MKFKDYIYNNKMSDANIKREPEIWKQIEEFPNYTISTWGNCRNDIRGHVLANKINNRGYVMYCLCYNGLKQYKLASRLVAETFLSEYSKDQDVDHRDRNKTNNYIHNLRMCSKSQNLYNTSIAINNTSTYKGVSPDYHKGKWNTRINKNHKRIHQAYFNSLNEAAKQYNIWAEQLFGEFANLNKVDETVDKFIGKHYCECCDCFIQGLKPFRKHQKSPKHIKNSIK